MIKLVISDLDGTFLNSKGDFDREMYKEVRKLMKKKVCSLPPVLENSVSG